MSSPERIRRVIQWSTGGVGRIAIRAIAERPDLELVGAWVHSAEKDGVDAGVLAGGAPLGVLATRDVERLLALGADCVSYAASGEVRGAECIDDFCRLLEAGLNVVTTSVPGFVHPAGFAPEPLARLQAAAEAGRASLFATGIEPGFAGDLLPLTLLTMSQRVRSVRTQELFTYAAYPVAFTLFEVFGFGKPAAHQAIMELPGVQASVWGPPIRMVAERLGARVESIRETYEKALTPRRLEIAAGTVEAGTVGAVRFETIAVVDGRDAIAIEHVNRLAVDLAPDWPSAARDGVYRIVVDGEPSITCELALGSPADFSEQGMIATAMRAVNAIPYVCDARPGVLGALDLPLTTPRFAL